MPSVATAWIDLVPSAAGFAKKLDGELGDVGESAGKKSSKGFLGSLGGAIGGVTKIAAGAVGIVGGLLGGIAIKGGVSRALNIEDAQAKLLGLGNSTETVETVMQNALAAVKGTAFGLGDAATVAAGAVAAGIKPGQDLERTLGLVGDAATIAGTDMGSMGSIFNKVAASGKIQGDVIAQLGDAGIPILQLLAAELGVTAAEVSDMASKGEVDFQTFQNAMEKGLGGAALKSGETFRGAMANTYAALGRIGETVMLPFLDVIKQGFNAAIPLLDSVNAALKPIMSTFGAWLTGVAPAAIAGFVAGMSGIATALSGIKALIVDGDFTGAFREAFNVEEDSPIVGFILNVRQGIIDLVGAIGPMVVAGAALLGSISPLSTVFQSIQPLLPQLLAVFQQLASVVGSTLLTAFTGMLPIVTQLQGVFVSLLTGVLVAVLPTVVQLITMLGQTFSQLLPVLLPIIATLASLAATLISQLAPVFLQLVTAILPPVVAIFGAVLAAILPLVQMIAGLLIPIIQALMPIVVTVFTAIAATITAAMQIIQGVIQVVTGIITGNWSQVWTGIQNIVAGVWEGIKAVISGAINIVFSVIGAVLGLIASAWTAAWDGMTSFISSAWQNIKTAVSLGINDVIGFVSALPGRITGALGNLGGLLLNAGSQIMQGLLDGIVAGFNAVKDFVGGIGSWIADNKGPKAYDLALLVPAGGWIMDGLEKGLEASIPSLQGTLGDVSSTIESGLNVRSAPSFAGATTGSGTGAATTSRAEDMRAALEGMTFAFVPGTDKAMAQFVRTGERKLVRA